VKYGYYPGCSAAGTGVEFDVSTKYVAKKIGMELATIPDWNCCGASSAHAVNHDLSVALPARNLAIAEKKIGCDVAVPCAACFARMKYAAHYVRESEENKKHVEYLIDQPYEAKNDVFCMLDVLSRPEALQAVKGAITKSLNGLKVACYYGCLLVRPPEINCFDDTENPTSMDILMEAAGAKAVDWSHKTECCGAGLQVTSPKTGREMIYRILKNAKAHGAEAIATACPLCMLNLDMREGQINKDRGTDFDMPVYYFTELLALAMGASPNDVGLKKHFYPAEKRVMDAINNPPKLEEKPAPQKAPAAAPQAANQAKGGDKN